MQDLDTKAVNALFMNNIMSDDSGQVKLAQQAVNDFTRVKMREDGFWRRILPPVPIANDELDRQVDTDKNVKDDNENQYGIHYRGASTLTLPNLIVKIKAA